MKEVLRGTRLDFMMISVEPSVGKSQFLCPVVQRVNREIV